MINLKATKVKINLIGNIGEEQEVTIPQGQLVGIVARNLDFGGSNSSGKSNFTYAIPINLYGPGIVGISNKEIKNDKIKGTAYIEVDYLINQTPMTIKRIIGGQLSLTYNNETINGSNPEVQAKIDALVGLNEVQFKQLAYKDQESAESFLTMKDADKKELLSSFFNTEYIDKIKEKSDIEQKELIKSVDSFEAVKASMIKTIEDSERSLNSQIEKRNAQEVVLKSSIQSVNEELLTLEDALSTEILRSIENDEDYKSLLSKKNTKLPELETTIALYKADLVNKAESINVLNEEVNNIPKPLELLAQFKECSEFITVLEQVEKSLQAKSSRYNIVKYEIDNLNKGLNSKDSCPTCKREMDQAHVEAHRKQLNDSILEKTKELEELSTSIKSLEGQVSQKNGLLEVKMKLKNDIDQYETVSKQDILIKIKDLNTDIRLINSNKSIAESELSSLNKELSNFETSFESAKKSRILDLSNKRTFKIKELETLNNSVLRLDDPINTYMEIISKNKKDLAVLINGNEKNSKKLELLKHISFISSKNGFIGHIFDSMLDRLNSEIKLNMSLIPITRDFTVVFKSDKEVKSTGVINKAITFDLYEGNEIKPFSRVSGGQKLGIILAVDEALDTVVSQMLGVNIGFKFLDERFHFIDNNSKEFIMDFLKAKSSNKSYLIIDHSSEFNSGFESIIEIVRQNGVATVSNLM